VDTGYQMLWRVTDDPTYRMNQGVPVDPVTALQTAVDNGAAAGARYLEIYYADIVNPDLQDVIASAHDRLTNPGPRAASLGMTAAPAEAPGADPAGPPSRGVAPAAPKDAGSDAGRVIPDSRDVDRTVWRSLDGNREPAGGVPALFGDHFPAWPGLSEDLGDVRIKRAEE
jgi:hypothetical protein